MKNIAKKISKKMKLFLNALYWVFFVGLAIVALLIIFTTLDTNLPVKLYTVQSGSMAPQYRKGTVIFVTKSDEYQVKEVITYQNPDRISQTITHRISAIEFVDDSPFYVTKGDANEDVDSEKIEANLIIGKVRFGIPVVGYIINFAKTRTGTILLVLVPAAIFVFGELKNLVTQIKIYKKGGELS